MPKSQRNKRKKLWKYPAVGRFRNKDLVRSVANATSLGEDIAEDVVEAILEILVESICRDKYLCIRGFGTFTAKVLKTPKSFGYPKTNKQTVYFRASELGVLRVLRKKWYEDNNIPFSKRHKGDYYRT